MKHNMTKIFLLLVITNFVSAGPLLDKTREITGSTIDMIGETASSVSKTVSGESESLEKTRIKIDSMANKGLSRLIDKYPEIQKYYKSVIAYAVFDSRKPLLVVRGC